MREVYDRDARGRLQVDTGFGAPDQHVGRRHVRVYDRVCGWQVEGQAVESDAEDSEGIRLEAR